MPKFLFYVAIEIHCQFTVYFFFLLFLPQINSSVFIFYLYKNKTKHKKKKSNNFFLVEKYISKLERARFSPPK